jgi:hypothetical protein
VRQEREDVRALTPFARLLAAWSRSETRDHAPPPGDDNQFSEWPGTPALDRAEAEIVRLRTAWREADQQHARDVKTLLWLHAEAVWHLGEVTGLDGCSCAGGHLVVIHDDGTYCGDAQHEQIDVKLRDHWPHLDPEPAATEVLAHAVLEALRQARQMFPDIYPLLSKVDDENPGGDPDA